MTAKVIAVTDIAKTGAPVAQIDRLSVRGIHLDVPYAGLTVEPAS